MVHFWSGKAIFFISDRLLDTNSSPPCKPPFSHSVPFCLHSQSVTVHRWHLREALSSVFRASLVHRTGQTFRSHWPEILFCITGEANPSTSVKLRFQHFFLQGLNLSCALLLMLLLNTPCCLITVYKNYLCWHRTEWALCIISSSICPCPLFQAYFTVRWFLERFSTDNSSKKRCC